MSILEAAVANFVDRRLAPSTRPARPRPEPHLVKGILAGLIGGLVATAAKTAAEKIYPPAPKSAATPPTHWAFGAAAGAAYGALAEFYPAATARDGVTFGMTLMALTHETTLPALGLTAAPETQTPREKTSEIASHIVYGLAAETTRRVVRKFL